MNYRELILDVVRNVARDKYPDVEAVRPDQTLVEDLGLTSLDLAVIIAKLERKLGVDPFAEHVAVTSIRTAGDLAAAYGKCLEGVEEAPQAEPPRARPQSALEAQRELRRKAQE